MINMRTYLILKQFALTVLLSLSVFGLQAQNSAARIAITGTVTDATTGEPVNAARVTFEGFSTALSGEDGKFSINAPNTKAILLITAEEYQTVGVPLSGRKTLEVKLNPEPFNSIFDNVALLYTSKRRSQSVPAVVSLTDNLSWQSNASPAIYAQGRVAGLRVIQRSGSAGAGANMFLRGYSSLMAGSQPLVVVDGVIYETAPYGTSLFSGYSTNTLTDIDMKDVQSISVIKDASASIYGAKSANGVVLINTLRAGDLATKITVHAYGGFNLEPDPLPIMDASGFRSYLNDVLASYDKVTFPDVKALPFTTLLRLSASDIAALPFMDATVPGTEIVGEQTERPTGNQDYYRYFNNTDWQGDAFKRGFANNLYLGVTGGDNIAKYALSLGTSSQEGIISGSDYGRYNMKFNSDVAISQKTTLSSNIFFANTTRNIYDEGVSPYTNPLYTSLVKAPFMAPKVFNNLGLVSPNSENVDVLGLSNPYAILNNSEGVQETYHLVGNFTVNHEFSPVFNLSGTFGLNFNKAREKKFIPQLGVYHADAESPEIVVRNESHRKVERLFSYYYDIRMNFAKTINRIHKVNGVFGFRYNNSQFTDNLAYRYNTANDLLRNEKGDVLLAEKGGSVGNWSNLTYYLNTDYNLKDRYFLSLNMALDGSTRFGKEASSTKIFDTAFGFFPSLSGAWLVSAENFMAGFNKVDLLKVRLSYGLTGNDDIGNYAARLHYVAQGLLGTYGVVLGSLANVNLQWETVAKANAGLDLAMFNERVSVGFDVYRNTTRDMLALTPAAAYSGYDYYLANSGKMVNNGVELAVNTRLVSKKDWKVDFGFNLATYKNKVETLPAGDVVTNIYGADILTRVGEPVGSFYGYKTLGLFNNPSEAAAANLQTALYTGELVTFQAGDIHFADLNGDGIINSLDRTIIGDPNPDVTGAFNARIQYKRFTLDAVATFSLGNDVYNYLRAQLEGMTGLENQSQAVMNRWRFNDQQTEIPRLTYGDPYGNSRFSDRWIEDGSYLRLKSVTLSYDIPFRAGFFKSALVYLQGNNLLTFSKYLGYDPEFSAGISPLYQGIDLGMVPQYKSVFVGVKLGL